MIKKAALLAAAAALAACGRAQVKKAAEFDVYLEQFEAVREEGADIYIRASGVAEELGGQKLGERKAAMNARLEALRIIDQYNRLLISMARGEDPKALKSGMKTIGGKLASYRPSAQSTFAFASAVPYVGVLVSGAGYVQEALAKRKFVKAVREAQKPIEAILDILILDAEPLETLLVQQVEKEQDSPRAGVDSLGGRFYRKLQALRATPDVVELVNAQNALRESAGFSKIPYQFAESSRAPKAADLEYLNLLKDQTALNLEAYKRCAERITAEQTLFKRYRAALSAAKGALAALNRDSEEEQAAATGKFNEEAMGVRQEAVKIREAIQ